MFLATAALSAILVVQAILNPIVPFSIEYRNGAEEDDQASMCAIATILENPTSPERVSMTAFVGYDKFDGTMAIGFIVGAAKRLPAGNFDFVDVSSGAFTSADFNSADEMDHEVSSDGTFMAATGEPDVADRFLNAFAAGDFYLTLSGDDSEEADWTYQIAKRPPENVVGTFTRCIERLVPRAASLRR